MTSAPALEIARATRLAREREELIEEVLEVMVRKGCLSSTFREHAEAIVDTIILPIRQEFVEIFGRMLMEATILECERQRNGDHGC